MRGNMEVTLTNTAVHDQPAMTPARPMMHPTLTAEPEKSISPAIGAAEDGANKATSIFPSESLGRDRAHNANLIFHLYIYTSKYMLYTSKYILNKKHYLITRITSEPVFVISLLTASITTDVQKKRRRCSLFACLFLSSFFRETKKKDLSSQALPGKKQPSRGGGRGVPCTK